MGFSAGDTNTETGLYAVREGLFNIEDIVIRYVVFVNPDISFCRSV